MSVEQWLNETDRGKPKYSEKNLSIISHTWTGLTRNLAVLGERPATTGSAFLLCTGDTDVLNTDFPGADLISVCM
jgi:hypothetical protein